MRIVIAEDAVLLRAGLVRLLTDAGHQVVAETDTAEGLVKAMEEHRPDFALVDVRLPPSFSDEGIRAAVLIRSAHPEVAVLVLSQYVEERYASELIASRREGLGYLLKDRVADVDQFLESVQTVGSGGTVLDPEVLTQILVRSRRREDMELLSPREREVLGLMAQGLSNASIAANPHPLPPRRRRPRAFPATAAPRTTPAGTDRTTAPWGAASAARGTRPRL